jgi:hypothetical protein
MTVPIGVLAAACIAGALAAPAMVTALESVLVELRAARGRRRGCVGGTWFRPWPRGLLPVLGIVTVLVVRWGGAADDETWGVAYAPTSRMQYRTRVR